VNRPDEFEEMMGREFAPEPVDPNPYNAHATQAKPGLTKRGKAVLAIGATVIVGGGFAFYQHNAAVQSANSVKTQELAIQQQKLELEKLKVLGQVNMAQQKTQSAADAARQKKIDACVAGNKGLVGKQLGATYRSVLDDCQAQYAATNTTGADMEAAASVTDSGTGGSNPTTVLLVGGGALVLGAGYAVRKGTRPTAA
jgi:hypothetical protein